MRLKKNAEESFGEFVKEKETKDHGPFLSSDQTINSMHVYIRGK